MAEVCVAFHIYKPSATITAIIASNKTSGIATAKAAEAAGLRIDINAPTAKAPSMTMALEQYITG